MLQNGFDERNYSDFELILEKNKNQMLDYLKNDYILYLRKILINDLKKEITINGLTVCGFRRTKNRGYCKRLTKYGICSYHLKNNKIKIEEKLFVNNMKNNIDATSIDNTKETDHGDGIYFPYITDLNNIKIKDNFLNTIPKFICYYPDCPDDVEMEKTGTKKYECNKDYIINRKIYEIQNKYNPNIIISEPNNKNMLILYKSPECMQLEFINYMNIKYKKYMKNRKKRKNKKKNKLPDLITETKMDYVEYLPDEKVNVYTWLIDDVNIYSDIFNNKILYYKYIAKTNYEKRIPEYIAYICYEKNKEKSFKYLSFIDLYRILSRVYNKISVIEHIKDISRGNIDISKLI